VREVNFDCSSVEKVELINVVVSSFWVVKVSIVLGLSVVVVIEVVFFVVKEEGSFELLAEIGSGVILVVFSVLTVVVVGKDDSDSPVENNKSEIVDFVTMLLEDNVEVGVKFVEIVDDSAELILVEDSSKLVPVVKVVGCDVDALVISSVVRIELLVVVRVVKYGFVDSSVIVEKKVGFVDSSVERRVVEKSCVLILFPSVEVNISVGLLVLEAV
jgi:hypothetical protein